MSKIADLLKSMHFTEDDIASRSRLSQRRVQEILRGGKVSQSELRALATGLRIPIRSFASGKSVTARTDQMGVLFRDAKFDKTGNFDSALEVVSSFVSAALDVLPKQHGFPNWLLDYSIESESSDSAERLALDFRSTHFPDSLDEPIINLPSLLIEKHNVVVSQLRNSQFEGASVVLDGYCFVFVSPRFPGRMLFTLAHELGHLLAHHKPGGSAIFDRPSEIGGGGRFTRPEAFVNAFASSVLLPARGVARSLRTIREVYRISGDQLGDVEISVLARAYGVSFEAAAYRCEQLELIPRGGAASLNSFIKKQYGSAEKRADALGLPHRQIANIPAVSENLLIALTEKIAGGDVSVGWASDNLGLPIVDLYEWHSKDHRGAVRH